MVTVRRIRIKGFKSRFRVTLYSKEGTYALLASKYRLGELLLPIARAQPIEVRLKSPVATDIPRGVKPVGKAARKALTYTPLKPRKKSTEEVTSAPAPKVEEVTSAVSPPPTTHGKKGKGKNGKKAVATAA